MKISTRLRAWLGGVIRESVEGALHAALEDRDRKSHAQAQPTSTDDYTHTRGNTLLPRAFPGIQLSDYAGWIGLIIALLPIVIGTLRLFVVARFDVDNAIILAANINLVAVFLSALPALSVMILMAAYWLFAISRIAVRFRWWLPAVVTAAYLVVIFFFASLVYAIILVASTIGALALYRKILAHSDLTERATKIWVNVPPSKQREFLESFNGLYIEEPSGKLALDMAPILRKMTAGFIVTFIYLTLVGSGLAEKPWLPREVVYLKSGGPREVYVLDVTDHDMTVLSVSRDSVYVLRQDDITGRRLCIRKDPDLPLLYTLEMTTSDLVFNSGTRSFVGGC